MSDQVSEPLIGNGADYDGVSEDLRSDEFSQVEDNNVRGTSWFIWLLTLTAGLSGLLFGYDTGVISATLVSIRADLSSHPLTTLDKSLITASTSLCALLISPISGSISDLYGRKTVLLISDIFFVLGAILQAVTTEVWLMVVGRGIIGLAVGSASFVTPMYIAELAPKEVRGRLITVNVGLITAGQVVAYLIGWGFAGQAGGWRWMVGLGGVPAFAQALLLLGVPESPRWLLKIGRIDAARGVLMSVYGKEQGKVVDEIVKGIEVEMRNEDEAKRGRKRALPRKYEAWFGDTWVELFRVPGHRRALSIACLLQGLQQLCGFNSLMYFSATIFQLLGFTNSTLTSLSVALTNLVFTAIAFFLIDIIGRRRILLVSVPVMTLALLSCSFFFSKTSLTHTNTTTTADNSTAPVLILLSIILYVASYAIGLGNVPWQQSELFPLSVRSLGSSLSTATNWGCNFVVGITFLPLLELWSPTVTFAGYAGICAIGWVLVWLIYPETKGLGLEEVGALLEGGWGVK